MIKKILILFQIKLLSILKKDATDAKIKLYRIRGYKIGDKCRIFTELGGSEAYLVSIGDNVTISTNVTLLTHDNSIIKISHGKYTDLFGEITIGNNCFIGANATILPGVSLADGTIVAAGSIVTKSTDKPSMIIGGNPAKIIGNASDYYDKNKNKAFNCANLNKTKRKEIIENNRDKLIRKRALTK